MNDNKLIKNMCCVCLTNEATIATKKCNHLVFCYLCFSNISTPTIDKCPFCRIKLKKNEFIEVRKTDISESLKYLVKFIGGYMKNTSNSIFEIENLIVNINKAIIDIEIENDDSNKQLQILTKRIKIIDNILQKRIDNIKLRNRVNVLTRRFNQISVNPIIHHVVIEEDERP